MPETRVYDDDHMIQLMLNKLNSLPDHPDYSDGLIDADSVTVDLDQNDPTRIEDLEVAIQAIEEGNISEVSPSDFVPVKRLKKNNQLQDLAPNVILSPETSFQATLENVSAIMTLKNAPSTYKVREYAYRSYLTWYQEACAC